MRTLSVVVTLAFLVGSVVGQGPVPKPGPEHEKLKAMAGTWRATMKSPAGGPEEKGIMVSKMDLGGLWLVSHFTSEKGDFSGRGMDTYDPVTKKYHGVWCDSMATTPMNLVGDFDGKKMSMSGEARGPDGKMMKMKMVTELKDNNHMVFNIYAPGPDGKEAVMFTINYERAK